MELESSATEFKPDPDRRPRVEEPPPVWLLTIADAELLMVAGSEHQLDAFYVELLRFERDHTEPGIAYRAENFRLRFRAQECPEPREDYRALVIGIPSLEEIVPRLIDAEVVYERLRDLLTGQDRLLIVDPVGNRLELFERRFVF
jgi:hypothetical protein